MASHEAPVIQHLFPDDIDAPATIGGVNLLTTRAGDLTTAAALHHDNPATSELLEPSVKRLVNDVRDIVADSGVHEVVLPDGDTVRGVEAITREAVGQLLEIGAEQDPGPMDELRHQLAAATSEIQRLREDTPEADDSRASQVLAEMNDKIQKLTAERDDERAKRQIYEKRAAQAEALLKKHDIALPTVTMGEQQRHPSRISTALRRIMGGFAARRDI